MVIPEIAAWFGYKAGKKLPGANWLQDKNKEYDKKIEKLFKKKRR